MGTFFGAIADDFTGATDLACLLARSGVPASLRMGVPPDPPDDAATMEIIALKCRTAPAAEAKEQALSALDWLRRAGARRFYWKYCSTFDSTPQGNIGPVAEALMAEIGADQTIYCVAFPENGRAVFMGHLFVGEQLLDESPMKDHPLTPMRDSSLPRLLRPQVTRAVGLADRLAVAKGAAALRAELSRLKGKGVAHVVVDAVANDDLRIIAEACRDMPLLTGASAVAMHLPGLWLEQGLIETSTRTAERRPRGEPAIVLAGSCSAMTNRQVQAYLAAGHPGLRLDPLELAANGPAAALAWLASQEPGANPVIFATAEPDSVRQSQQRLGVERAGTLVEAALAACAGKARDLGIRRFVVAGGETSGAVVKALGMTRLDVGPEIAPGVPWCFGRTAGRDVAITLKSGNFGNDSFFSDALRVLDT